MKKIIVLLLCLGLVGCISLGNVDRLRAANGRRLVRLNIGMAEVDVLHIMGDASATDRNFLERFTVNNPHKSEILQGKNKTLKVVYYYTDIKEPHRFYGFTHKVPTVKEDDLTPLVFDEGKLIGWGWGFLQNSIQKYEIRVR
ncbi:DUF3192 domain-containing protein [Candidatus Omnitrophota bacterium]